MALACESRLLLIICAEPPKSIVCFKPLQFQQCLSLAFGCLIAELYQKQNYQHLELVQFFFKPLEFELSPLAEGWCPLDLISHLLQNVLALPF